MQLYCMYGMHGLPGMRDMLYMYRISARNSGRCSGSNRCIYIGIDRCGYGCKRGSDQEVTTAEIRKEKIENYSFQLRDLRLCVACRKLVMRKKQRGNEEKTWII